MFEPAVGGVQNPAGGEQHEGPADARGTRRLREAHTWLGLREVPSSEVTYQPVHTGAQYTGPCRASLRRINGEVVAKEEDNKDDKSCFPELFEACNMEYV